MSFPEGKDLILMGNEAAKAAEAYQKTLKGKTHQRSKSVGGDSVPTISATIETPPVSGKSATTSIRDSFPKEAWPDTPSSDTPPNKKTAESGTPIAKNHTSHSDNSSKAHTPSNENIYDEIYTTNNGRQSTPEPKKKILDKKVSFNLGEKGKYTKLEMEALELLSDNEDEDKESSILTFEEKDTVPSSMEARLEAIEEKLSMILGLLRTLSVATAGPTAARDGIRDAMVGIREELIADIIKEARGKVADMMREEEAQKIKIGDGSVKLTEKAKELNKIIEDESTSGDSENTESEGEIDSEADTDDDESIYKLTM
ncbi:phosphoprotein [Gull metapneumovirus]|nr:phosphoprotein [Gull metapneumovirus]